MIKRLLAFIFLTACAFGQSTTTVTGNLKNLGTGSVSSNSFVRFYLRGCAGNQPRINGTAIIAPTQGNVYYFDFVPNGSGAISGTLYSTRDAGGTGAGAIECGGSFTSVWYGMTPFLNGKAGPETPVHAKASATLDISNVTPINTTPVVTAPTGDGTYARLDAGNQPFTGSLQIPSNGVYKISSDTGGSRDSAGVIDIGNGTQGDKSGGMKMTTLTLNKSDGTVPATITNDTAGGIVLAANVGAPDQLQLTSGGNLFLQTKGGLFGLAGATSGTTNIQASATASGMLTLPAATDTLVGKSTVDTLTNKTLTSPTITSPTVNGGIANNGTGLMHVRTASCTTAASANASCNQTINWPGTWANTSYTASCTLDSPSGGNTWVVATQTKSTTQITVIIQNVPGNSAASNGTLNCIGIHD